MICPKCNRNAGNYVRLKTKELVCRYCGQITPMSEVMAAKEEKDAENKE